MTTEKLVTPLASLLNFIKLILTGERKKVNNDFARQELFLIPETNQPAEAGFFVAAKFIR